MNDLDTRLERLADEARRQAIRQRIEALDVFRRLPEKVRRADGLRPRLTPASVPASFWVTLRQPVRISEFKLALCGGPRTGDCPYGVTVLQHPRPRSG